MPLVPPHVGDAAPPLDLPVADGSGRRSLSDFRGRPVLVSFLGPAHCTFCRAHVIRTIQRRDEFARLNADVILVGYEDPQDMTSMMLRNLDLPYTILVDPSRETHRRWGMGEATWRVYVRPGLYLALLTSLLRREEQFKMQPTPSQMTGDFVVGRDGRVAFARVLKSFHDRASVSTLLSAIASA
jgi:peroxiredoxin